MVRSHWLYRGKRGSVPKRAEARPSREVNSRQKRGPATGKTPPWRAERRGRFGNKALSHEKLERRLARHTLDCFEGDEKGRRLTRGRKEYGRRSVG
jgi:hypothetical protein